MIRTQMTRAFALIGALIAGPLAFAQEPSTGESTNRLEKKPSPANPMTDQEKTPEDRPASSTRTYLGAGVFRPTQRQTLTIQTPSGVQKQTRTIERSDPLDRVFGLSLAKADDVLRSQLEIPAGQGLVIVTLKPESLGEQVGFKLKDVLLSLGDKPAKDVAEASKILLGLTREAIPVKLIRQGKRTQLNVVGPAHGLPADPIEYWLGVPVSLVDETLRVHLPGLGGAGLIVNDVVPASPAETAGLKKNDILISIGGSKPLKDPTSLIAAIQASEGKAVAIEILRGGKPMTLTVTPGKRASSTVAWVDQLDFLLKTTDVTNLEKAQGLQDAEKHPALSYFQVLPPYVTVQVDPQAQKGSGDPTSPLTSKIEVKVFDDKSGWRLDLQDLQGLRKQLQESNQLPMLSGSLVPPTDERSARIEAQLKDVTTKLDAILEMLKKSEKK